MEVEATYVRTLSMLTKHVMYHFFHFGQFRGLSPSLNE